MKHVKCMWRGEARRGDRRGRQDVECGSAVAFLVGNLLQYTVNMPRFHWFCGIAVSGTSVRVCGWLYMYVCVRVRATC